jgi:hypothetical protein
MKDIDEMTAEQHHLLCMGVMAECYQHVPEELRIAIYDGITLAQKMGAPLDPENVDRNLPLAMNQ